MFSKRESQSGQVLVIIVFMILGIFGFAALAIDGGMLYAERRRAQNAADAGALAAALAKVQGVHLYVAALQRIESNGYPSTWGPCDPPGYDCTLGTGEKWAVQVSNPPRSGTYVGNNAYIQVLITSKINTSFAHLVFDGGLLTTVIAESRVRPEQSLSPGHALYSASEHDCKGIWFSGTGDTVITGGDVFSNSDANDPNCQSGVQDGGGDIFVGPPPHGIEVVGTFDDGGSGSVNPPPNEGVPQEDLRTPPTPDCSGLPEKGTVKINAGETRTLNQGRYESIKFGANATVTMNSGMYCIYGTKGFTGTGGSINGTGVLIYLQQGGLDLGGNTLVDLRAEQTEGVLVDPSRNDWKGMLVYQGSGNTSPVEIAGTSDSTYTGTIYAPSAECKVNGTGDNLGLNSQLICDKVKITGTAAVTINYVEDENYYLPPAIDLAR